MSNRSEDQLQQSIYIWFHNTFPEKRGLLCYNLNNSKNKIDGNLNRSKGLQAGRSDLVYYRKGRAYMIELKTESGSQEPAQKKWESLIKSEGFIYVIIRDLPSFKAFIKKVDDLDNHYQSVLLTI